MSAGDDFETITFDSQAAADEFRDRFPGKLAPEDDPEMTTVRVRPETDRFVFMQAEMIEKDVEGEVGDDGDDQAEPVEEMGDEGFHEVEFGNLGTANDLRDRDDMAEYLDDADNRSMKTVRFEPDTPEHVLNLAETLARTGRTEQEIEWPDVDLTDEEWERIKDRFGASGAQDFSRWEAIKARFEGYSVPGWLQHVFDGMTTDEAQQEARELALEGVGQANPDRLEGRADLERDTAARAVEAVTEQGRGEIQRQIDEHGIEAVADALAGNPVASEVQEDVEAVVEQLPNAREAYEDVIAQEVTGILELIGSDLDLVREGVQQRERQAGIEAGRRRALQRLSSEFGIQFGSIDEAARRIRERVEEAREGADPFPKVGDIRVRKATGDVRIFVEDNDDADPYMETVRRQVREAIDLESIPSPQTVTVGQITTVGGDLDEIDLSEGIESVNERDPREGEAITEFDRTEEEPEPSETEELADSFLEDLEG